MSGAYASCQQFCLRFRYGVSHFLFRDHPIRAVPDTTAFRPVFRIENLIKIRMERYLSINIGMFLPAMSWYSSLVATSPTQNKASTRQNSFKLDATFMVC